MQIFLQKVSFQYRTARIWESTKLAEDSHRSAPSQQIWNLEEVTFSKVLVDFDSDVDQERFDAGFVLSVGLKAESARLRACCWVFVDEVASERDFRRVLDRLEWRVLIVLAESFNSCAFNDVKETSLFGMNRNYLSFEVSKVSVFKITKKKLKLFFHYINCITPHDYLRK